MVVVVVVGVLRFPGLPWGQVLLLVVVLRLLGHWVHGRLLLLLPRGRRRPAGRCSCLAPGQHPRRWHPRWEPYSWGPRFQALPGLQEPGALLP